MLPAETPLVAELIAERHAAAEPEGGRVGQLGTVGPVARRIKRRAGQARDARAAIEATGVRIIDLDADQACLSGKLHPATRAAGRSLGDRAWLSLALLKQLPAMTADTPWRELSGFDVIFIR